MDMTNENQSYATKILQILAENPERMWCPHELALSLKPRCFDVIVGYYCRVLADLGIVLRVGRGVSRDPYKYGHNPRWKPDLVVMEMREFLNGWKPTRHDHWLDSVVEEFLEDYERVKFQNGEVRQLQTFEEKKEDGEAIL